MVMVVINTIPSSKSIITIPLLLVSVVIELFLYIDGAYFFGSIWTSTFQTALTTYLIISSSLLIFSFAGIKGLMDLTFWDAIIFFVPTFIITTLLVGQTTAPVKQPANYIVAMIIFQIFVVSITEELMFRGILIKYVGVVGQAILFTLFHLVAYTTELGGLSIVGFIEAFIMGLLLGFIIQWTEQEGMKSQGLAITWGIHAGWNVAVATGIFYFMG
jgi:membrane protease YdiL (CAAX protease family)